MNKMNNLEEWYSSCPIQPLTMGKTQFKIYKGFKISLVEGMYRIQDTRFRDMYDKVSKKDMKVLNLMGFVEGADTLAHARDCKRVENYHKKVEKLYNDMDSFKYRLKRSRLKKSIDFLEKRIRNCDENIKSTLDSLFYYRVKINQFKEKYN